MISLVICPKCGNSVINKPYEELIGKIMVVGNQIELEELQKSLTKGREGN